MEHKLLQASGNLALGTPGTSTNLRALLKDNNQIEAWRKYKECKVGSTSVLPPWTWMQRLRGGSIGLGPTFPRDLVEALRFPRFSMLRLLRKAIRISLNPDVRTPWSSSSPSRSPLATAHAASSIRSAENTWSLDAALRTARAVLASWGPRNPRLVVNPVVPMTLAHVYQVHDEIERLVEPSRLAGWKLGAPGASVDEDTGKPCVAVVAPLLRETIADENLAFSIEGSKLFGVEVEIAFVMKSDLVPLVKDGSCETKTTEAVENPQSGAFDVDEVWEAVGETRLALELIGSRLPSLENAPGLLKLADLICAGGVVLGQRVEVADPRDLANVAATLSFDGVVVDTGKAEVCPAGSPIDALVWLANHLAKRGKYLRAGDVIISGKICVATGINSYQRVSAEFSGLGSVSTFLLP